MKSTLAKLSVAIAALSYGYMTVTTSMGSGEGLSFTTFILWSFLAGIACYNLIKEKGSWGIAAMYTAGATSVAVTLICKGRMAWSNIDTLIAILVAICVYLSKTKGPKWGLIASVAAGVIAGIPFIILTWKNPATSPIIPNAGFLIGNSLSFFAGKTWKMEDRLYGGANAAACILLVMPWVLWRFA